MDFSFNGQRLTITYETGPEHGIWVLEMDGRPLRDEEDRPLEINAYSARSRFENTITIRADAAGTHVLSLTNPEERDPRSTGNSFAVTHIAVLPPLRQSNLGLVIGMIFALEVVCLLLALALGRILFSVPAAVMNTKRSLLLALFVYAVIAVWGFFLDSTLEFWFLAWMVAIVQGGSQALSRSLYASMAPAAKSGEFFGLFGVMEKFSSILGPFLFALAGAVFASSRPAILSLIAFFLVGIFLLSRVDVDEGRRVAQEENARLLGAAAP